MRYNVRLGKRQKSEFCRKCNAYLRPGVSCRIRLRDDKQAVVVTCLACGSVARHPYIRERGIIKKRRKKA
jgi:ribonuclease P protein subunit RPR2